MPRYNTIQSVNNAMPSNSYLKAIKFAGFRKYKNGRSKLVLCECKCGNLFVGLLKTILKGGCKSCGCLKQVSYNKTHGLSEKHLLYGVWCGMRRRCRDNTIPNFHRYGGRGIKVCPQWDNDFMTFYNWAIDKWGKGLHLDRINNDGNYEPDNCRFVTPLINARNKKTTIYLSYNGKRMTIIEWAKELDIYPMTIRYRYLKGWAIEKVLSKKDFHTENAIRLRLGKNNFTLPEWSEYLKIPLPTLWHRYYKGWETSKILSKDKFLPSGNNQYTKNIN